jgi:hypothetical protein
MARTIALLSAILTATAIIAGTDRATAEGNRIKIISSDATSRFIALGVSKSVVLDLPRVMKRLLLTDPGVVEVVVITNRRVQIIGKALGQTNVYFYDAAGRQIGAFDVAIISNSPPGGWEHNHSAANVVLVWRANAAGVAPQFLSCSPLMCTDTSKPGANEPPGTENINVMGSASSVNVGGK